MHLGFVDLNGGLGRRFGSLGLAIDGVATTVTASPSDQLYVVGPGADRARGYAEEIITQGDLPAVNIELSSVIPEHSGLGSGTQLSLAVATAIHRLFGVATTAREAAALLQRGKRSGIGVGAFEHGGFLIDGGPASAMEAPRITARADFPGRWRAILILDRQHKGLHGDRETDAFRRLHRFPEQNVGRICRLVLMQILPALAESRFGAFAGAIGEIQKLVGDYFAPAQGGRYTSADVGAVLQWLESQGLTGLGQSSWGPTGFVFVDSDLRARELVRDIGRRFGRPEHLELRVVSGRNSGGRVEINEARLARHGTGAK